MSVYNPNGVYYNAMFDGDFDPIPVANEVQLIQNQPAPALQVVEPLAEVVPRVYEQNPYAIDADMEQPAVQPPAQQEAGMQHDDSSESTMP